MKIKRKTPLFSAIVLRVLEARFEEIMRVKMVSDTTFELGLKPQVDHDQFISNFDSYMVHLVSEFGDPESIYTFQICQHLSCLELYYGELNNEVNVIGA